MFKTHDRLKASQNKVNFQCGYLKLRALKTPVFERYLTFINVLERS